MEINPFDSRLRMLDQLDSVQMLREVVPDEETAGCPGCPYFWTCPVPHRGEEVRAPQDIELEDVRETLGPRRAYVPRDESDVGWTDVWLDEEGLPIPEEQLPEELRRHRRLDRSDDDAAADATDEDHRDETPRRSWRDLFRRR